jgi:hypothetical protein
MEVTEKTLKARRDAYLDGMDNFTMLRYTAAMESLNKTLEATLQDNEMTGILSADSVSQASAILAAADMLGSKLTAIDKSIQNMSVLVGRVAAIDDSVRIAVNVLDEVSDRLESIGVKLDT